MKNWKGLQMNKISSIIIASLVVSCSYAPAAHAWGAREQGILTGVAGLWVYQQLAKPPAAVYQQPVPVYVPQPQTVYVYPTQAPVIQYPNTVCELRSEYVNGQVITGNFCYQR
jgi:hypothetical protein